MSYCQVFFFEVDKTCKFLSPCSYLEFLQTLEDKVDQDWEGISPSLEEIRRSLLSRSGCLINMTAEGKNLTSAEKYVSKFLDLLPASSPYEATTWNARLSSGNEAIVIPTQVRMLLFSSCSTCSFLRFLFGIIISKCVSTG